MPIAVSVSEGAQNTPKRKVNKRKSNVPKSLAEYVQKEYPSLTNQESGSYSIPSQFQVKEFPLIKGDMAELEVFTRLRAVNIPGLAMLIFHGNCYAGRRYAGDEQESGLIPREVDFAVFLRFKNKFKCLILEVKGSDEDTPPKNVSNMRRHALTQLKDHKEILGYEHGLSEETIAKIQTLGVWPNLNSFLHCNSCNKDHKTFMRKPDDCKNRGNQKNQNKDSSGERHLFSDTLCEGWLQRFLDSEEHLLSEKDWTSCLNVFLLLSVGSLYDEMEKTFFLLNPDQFHLLCLPSHLMCQPRFISGPAGSGKTLAVIAKIEDIVVNNKVDGDKQILYVCENVEVHKYVQIELKKRNIPIENIKFKTMREISHSQNDVKEIFDPIFKECCAIFLDEAEDWDTECLNKIYKGNLSSSNLFGYFWILFDHLQSSSINAGSAIPMNSFSPAEDRFPSVDSVNQLGFPSVDSFEESYDCDSSSETGVFTETSSFTLTLGDICTKDQLQNEEQEHLKLPTIWLRRIYRSAGNIHNFMKDEPLIAMYDPAVKMGHKISGPDKVVKNFMVKNFQEISSDEIGKNILRDICMQVLSFVCDQGVHPGDIAVTFDEHDCQTLFGPNKEVDLRTLEDITTSKFESTRHGRVPLPSSDISQSTLFPHEPKLTDCNCKYFIGPYRKLKGLTVKVVIFISIQGTTRGHNRVATYTSLSRSSCTFVMFYVQVKGMSMKEYQIEKMRFYKEFHHDEGHGRKKDFSFFSHLHDQYVMYVQPNESCESNKSSYLPQIRAHGNSASSGNFNIVQQSSGWNTLQLRRPYS